MKRINLKEWRLRDTGCCKIDICAEVPGDITRDLYKNGFIKDPFYGFNYKDCEWVSRTDFVYTVAFDFNRKLTGDEEVYLNFDGIDLFSEIYLNDKLLGKTEDMFLKYRYRINDCIKEKGNLLTVKMFSALNAADGIDCKDYFGTFNIPRIFLRKAQCHFGWDWAPKLVGYGLWKDVYVTVENKYRICDLYYKTDNGGFVTLFAELSYNINPYVDTYGREICGTGAAAQNDRLVFSVSKRPFGEEYQTVSAEVKGKINFANIKIENPELWWPKGYGGQPLYNYKAELFRGGIKVSERHGRLAFRSVRLAEEPCGADRIGFAFLINGEKVFLKGSNWVPSEVFTGTVTEKKYRKLLDLAERANYNAMRVWGGGIYENDIFYDLCDEKGIAVIQDFMLSCADIPEEDGGWVSLMLKECEYQLKRLRNHPCIIYWTGGNERPGSLCLQRSRGSGFAEKTLRGLVAYLDDSRPYGSQSPMGHTEIGNEKSTGDVHVSFVNACLFHDVKYYRERLSENAYNFISESAIMGPNSLETNKKMFPGEDLAANEALWRDRLMDNPYGGLDMDFFDIQRKLAESLYGKIDTLRRFTAKGMLAHAEFLKAESEFARFNKGITWGYLNWMYNDIWPSGTWSVADYYTEPKEAYYMQKRAYSPTLVSFVNAGGRICLFAVNDGLEEVRLKMVYGVKNIDGTKVWEKRHFERLDKNGKFIKEMPRGEPGTNEYFYVYAADEKGGRYRTLYSDTMWSGCDFKSRYTVAAERVDDYTVKVHISAEEFAKSVFVSFPDNYKYIYSDNYIDAEKGETVTVTVTSEEKIDLSKLSVTDFAVLAR